MRIRVVTIAKRWAMRLVVIMATLAIVNPTAADRAAAKTAPQGGEQPHRIRAASGQITAHDGKFWLGSTQVILRGFNWAAGYMPTSEKQKMGQWGANFVRLRVHWADLEPQPPQLSGTTWKHTYDPTHIQRIKDDITTNYQNGLYTLVDNHPCSDDETCSYFGWPMWLYQAQYNSHGKTYQTTPDDNTLAQGDFWTDTLRKQFQMDEWKYLVSQVSSLPGIMGYELLNEPRAGYYDNTHATTQMILDYQLTLAQAIRAIDPNRVIVFTTRAGYGPGVQDAGLSGFVALGNCAFDLHDYFGARWGDGINENPANPQYTEMTQVLYDNASEDILGPYFGTTYGHERIVQQLRNRLALPGHGNFPMFVGEVGDDVSDTGIYVYYGTAMSAYGNVDASWAAVWGGHLGIADSLGNLQPWAPLVINAL